LNFKDYANMVKPLKCANVLMGSIVELDTAQWE